MTALDWKSFENAVAKGSFAAASGLMDRCKGTFYAVAFHEFYAETHDVIAMPCLAANTEEALAEQDDHWSSPDWKWIQLPYKNAESKKLHRALEKEAASRDEDYWYKIHARFTEAFIRVAKKLQRQLKKRRNVDKDFGVFVFANDDEVEVLQRCTTPSQFRKLFPSLQAGLENQQKLASTPLNSKLTTYQTDLHKHKSDVLELGESAIPMLLDALQDREQAWIAADILGELGIADSRVIDALRTRSRKGGEANFHDTVALGRLGDIDFLLELADSRKTQAVAIKGIKGLYSIGANWCRRKLLLNYGPIERLLEKPTCNRKVKELWSGHCKISESEVAEAIRGLNSKHVVIREHAVLVLGDRRLGAKAAGRILPALASRLQDSDANVRRLSMLAVSYWKKTAKPFADQVRKLFNDPDSDVRYTAKRYVKELG